MIHEYMQRYGIMRKDQFWYNDKLISRRVLMVHMTRRHVDQRMRQKYWIYCWIEHENKA